MSHGRRSVRSLGGAPLSRALRRADCHGWSTTGRNHGPHRPRPTPPPIPPPTGALFRLVLPCVLWPSASWSRAACERAGGVRAGGATDNTNRQERPSAVRGEWAVPRPPQRTRHHPPTHSAGALPYFVLPCVGSRAAASCARAGLVFARTSAVAVCCSYGADAACLAGSAGGRRAEVTRTGTDVRERAPAEVRVLPRGLNPGAGLGVPEEQEAEQAAGHHQRMVERGRGG